MAGSEIYREQPSRSEIGHPCSKESLLKQVRSISFS